MNPSRWIIRNIEIIRHNGKFVSDILIEKDKIIDIDRHIKGSFSQEIDGYGKIALPGLIDPHVHMELPVGKYTSADDFFSGSVAAAFGGITTFIDFTTPFPGETLEYCIQERLSRASVSVIDYALHATVCGVTESRLKELYSSLKYGITSFKFFTAYKESNRQTSYSELESIAEFFSETGALMLVHAEDQNILDKHKQQKSDSFIYYAQTRPPEAEAQAIFSLAEIQRRHHIKVYIVHLSSAEGLHAARNESLILETCPQYLILDDSLYKRKDGYRYAVAPPLRNKSDQSVLWNAVSDGLISTIGTDHCPFDIHLKDNTGDHYLKAPFGLPGVETLLPLLITFGVKKNKITWEKLVQCTSFNPAKIFNLFPDKGIIETGSDADIVIVNQDNRPVDVSMLHGKGGWNPYSGLVLSGWPEVVISRGELLVFDGKFLGRRGRGKFLFRSR